MFTLYQIRVVTILNFLYERRFSTSYHHMTKLKEDFKYERLLEQVGVTNVSSCYRDHGNPAQCKRGLN